MMRVSVSEYHFMFFIGSSIKVQFGSRVGGPVLLCLPEIAFIDSKAGDTARNAGCAYDRTSHTGKLGSALDEVDRHGWTVVDMKLDRMVI